MLTEPTSPAKHFACFRKLKKLKTNTAQSIVYIKAGSTNGTYTPFINANAASTTNATNTVTAIPADANATIEITNKGPEDEEATPVVNGRAVTWATGANTLTVKVTSENGTTTQSYVVTVTKS